MKSIKSLFVLLLVLCIGISLGCDKKLGKIKVLVPSGAPLIAVGDLLDHKAFDFTISNGADLLSASLVQDEYDFIVAPLNLGAKLYLEGKSDYKLAAILTTNNTYLVSKNKLDSINDLANVNILGYGQNSTPDILLKAALEKNSVTVSGINYQTSVADVMSLFMTSSEGSEYSLLAEPQLTKVKEKMGNSVNVLDIAEEYGDNAIFPQACLFVKSNLLVDYDDYLDLIEDNVEYLNRRPAKYAEKIENKNELFTSLTKATLEKALPNCNITYLEGEDYWYIVEDYIDMLNKYAPKLLGGKTVDRNFYYD